jgi:hypothetical protein
LQSFVERPPAPFLPIITSNLVAAAETICKTMKNLVVNIFPRPPTFVSIFSPLETKNQQKTVKNVERPGAIEIGKKQPLQTETRPASPTIYLFPH